MERRSAGAAAERDCCGKVFWQPSSYESVMDRVGRKKLTVLVSSACAPRRRRAISPPRKRRRARYAGHERQTFEFAEPRAHGLALAAQDVAERADRFGVHTVAGKRVAAKN